MATANELRIKVRDKYRIIIGRNKYNQDRRNYCYKKFKDGKYYSDCSSSVSWTYREVDLGFGILNTVGMWTSKKLVDVPVVIKNGIIQNPEVLRIGDMLLFAGTNSSRKNYSYVGHVEMVGEISSGRYILYGHGSGLAKKHEMNAYCRSRYNTRASIALAFANVHMSGASTGGVAFGQSSSSSEDSPKFECEFPAYFNAGIASHEYHDGDVVTIRGATFFGYVTSDSSSIRFVIPLRKSLERINSATLTQLKANIANNGGYAMTSSSVSGGSNYIASNVTRSVSVDKIRNVLEVYLNRSAAWDLTNNDNLSVRNEIVSITLHE